MKKFIIHYGTKRHSGRYPWGSGENPGQRTPDLLMEVEKLRKQGLSEVEVAKGLGMSIAELRKKKSLAKDEKRAELLSQVLKLKEKGYSNVAIGRKLGINESTVRSIQDPIARERSKITAGVADVLAKSIEEKGMIDIGLGTEAHMGISRTRLLTAVSLLQEEGYTTHEIQIPTGTGKYTTLKVLAPPNTTTQDVFKNRSEIKMISDYSEDGGRSFRGLEPIASINRDRILIRYGEEGGSDKDGIIELRRGVDDLSLGNSKYAQVRIGVDGTHYMKGMAIYSDDIPNGKDIIYNTNKPKGTEDQKVFKEMKDDPDNPFGSTIRQKHYIGPDGKEHLSALNIVGSVPGAGEEGSWGKWSKTISSQVLSKQPPSLAKKQLREALEIKKEEFDEIMSLTNPVIKKKLLETFADEADSAAVHLKAAALPRQSNHVILPINSLKENEVYAPNFKSGEIVVLIRHPHAGTFEIPELVVNNKNPEANRIMKNAKDAVGINPKVAQRLSGADFDGDTVLVIPNNKGLIKTSPALRGLADFDHKASYKKYPGMKVMTEEAKQHKMGDISNLITDMTIKGATPNEIARAVRHSMVVIDAVKHELDYKRSYADNNIAELKQRYQDGGGASTLISRAKSVQYVNQRTPGKIFVDPVTGKKKKLFIDPVTGDKLFTETGKSDRVVTMIDPVTGKKKRVYTNDPNASVVLKKFKTTKMAEASDAYSLSSGTPIEGVYADYANSLKQLARQARKESLNVGSIPYSHSARIVYSKEVASLKSSLAVALRNKPLERQAQLLANKVVSAKKRANPEMTKEEFKKLKTQVLDEMRRRTGAKRSNIKINDREWEAIQAGAITKTTLSDILLNTDLKELKVRSMPQNSRGLSPARIARARTMINNGSTTGEVAQILGVSPTTLLKALE